MIRQPQQPSSRGAQFNYARESAEHVKQRVQAIGNQTVTTHGTLPPMRKIDTAEDSTSTSQTILPLGMVFRGEYSTGLDYEPGDVVVVFGGIASGAFVCISLAPAGSPVPGVAANENWFRISAGFTPTVWE